jgi:membrane-bound lytic murein transglycosylase F
MAHRFCRAAVGFLVVTLLACGHGREPADAPRRNAPEVPPILAPPVERDLAAIRERGEVVMLTPTNSTSYFLYRGEPLGFEYELLERFAADHGLAFRVEVVTNPKELIARLNRGDGDVAGGRLEKTEEDARVVAFTRELYRSEPVLVQREAPVEAAKLPEEVKETVAQSGPPGNDTELRARIIEKPWQLEGERVDVPDEAAHKRTLVELEDEISGDIHVVEMETDDEALIQKVASGEVAYTVTQENLARLKEAAFTNLRVRPILGRDHKIAWAVRSNAPELRRALDDWIDGRKDEKAYAALYDRYFGDRRAYKERAKSEYLTSVTGRLCRYDDLLKRYAPELGWDWRLLASQAYQESRFEPDARSWAGALGLLQLMPGTAKQYGVADPYDPEQNVQGAVSFLAWLERLWAGKIPDENERLKFILASYNTGPGHVLDARRLAAKHGGDQAVWRDVAFWLLQKSRAEVHSDPVVEHGFCRGVEPVTYVEKILYRFDHYKRFVKS